MKLFKNIEIVDLGLKYKDNLIIGDLQLGYEEYLHSKGMLIPKFQLNDILERLERIFSKVKIKRIIINGDIKHEFGIINKQEWSDVLKLFDYLISKVEEIIVIKGNHDNILAPILKQRNLKLIDYWEDDDITIIHGDKIIIKLNKIIIISHEHPAISFKEKPADKFKCFLVGKFQRKNLIIMPSFSNLTVGTDVRNGKFLSPYLKNVDNFECYVVDDKGNARNFGKIKELPT